MKDNAIQKIIDRKKGKNPEKKKLVDDKKKKIKDSNNEIKK